MGQPLYVETLIRAGIDEIWRRTQDPRAHVRWDLRFTRIEAMPATGPNRFRYTLRVLPGLVISGTGTNTGERVRADGTRTSALRFASDDPRSLIRDGAGYWRYVPTRAGHAGEGSAVRFLTRYDYRPGWGRFGGFADRAFRPVLGWATAWSFDRLRLWLERGIDPRRALRNGLAEVAVRGGATVAALVWGTWWLAVATAVVAVLLPPAPTTPAARRCRRRPPDRLSARAPSTLATLPDPRLATLPDPRPRPTPGAAA